MYLMIYFLSWLKSYLLSEHLKQKVLGRIYNIFTAPSGVPSIPVWGFCFLVWRKWHHYFYFFKNPFFFGNGVNISAKVNYCKDDQLIFQSDIYRIHEWSIINILFKLEKKRFLVLHWTFVISMRLVNVEYLEKMQLWIWVFLFNWKLLKVALKNI